LEEPLLEGPEGLEVGVLLGLDIERTLRAPSLRVWDFQDGLASARRYRRAGRRLTFSTYLS
ncbi:MAG TPA: hypothetical protein VNO34_08540, partial [Actinomycetota bacterium]|nr:hypothetical protein [Actinomycetota bacterium]